MPWSIYALISVVSISIASVLQKKLMTKQEKDPLANAIVFQLLLGLFFFVFTAFYGFKAIDFALYGKYILFSTVFWGLSTYMSFKAIKLIGASDLTIIVSSSAIFSVIASLLFLKETLTLNQALGIIFILLAVILVNIGIKKNKSLNAKGVVFGLLVAFFGGIAVVSDVYAMKHNDLNTYITLMSFTPGIFLFLLSPKSLSKIKEVVSFKELKLMIVFTFFYAVQAITYYLAINSGAALSQMAPISKASIVLTVFLSFIFLKETENIKTKLFALVVVLIGVFLVG